MAIANFVIAALAAVAALASAIISYRILSRQAAADLPSIEASLRGNPPTCELVVTMTNRSICEWHMVRATAIRPWGTKLISTYDLVGEYPDQDEIVSKQRRSARAYLRVAPSGRAANGLINGSGDRHSETLIVSLPRWTLSRTLSIRLSLASSEADQRRTTIDIVRELPAATKAAMD